MCFIFTNVNVKQVLNLQIMLAFVKNDSLPCCHFQALLQQYGVVFARLHPVDADNL